MAAAEASFFDNHVVDLVAGAWLLFYAFRGYMHGLFREVMALIALLLALAAAFRWTPDLVPRFAESIPGPSFVDTAITFLFVFALTDIVLHLLIAVTARVWPIAGSSPINRLGGTVFGLTKGAVALGSTVLMLRTFTPTPAGAAAAGPLAGALEKLNERMAESPVAGGLAELTSGLFSTVMDAAEIRLRMLAASDNEGP